MGSDRGEYRPIRRVLLDGPDFQQLSERARWVFVALKLNLGPTGIEVHYRDAVPHQLAEQTGAKAEQIAAALDELEATDWIRREANILWIVGQLTHDPHVNANDEKHRKSIWKHLKGLPRLAIVRRFIEEHPDWFVGHDVNPLEGLPEGPKKGHRRASVAPNTDNREPKTDKDTNADALDGGAVEDRTAEEEFFDVEVIEPSADEPHATPGTQVIPFPQRAEPTITAETIQSVPMKLKTWEVLGAWAKRQETPPDEAEKKKQGAAAKRIASSHGGPDIVMAFLGIETLFPHSDGTPWDLFDLEKKFSKAKAAAVNHPEVQRARRDAEFEDILAQGGVWR